MPLITQGKTNWKFLLIVFVLAAVTGGGVLYYFSTLTEYEPPILSFGNNITGEKTSLEQTITKLLPEGAYLRDFEMIPGVVPDSYLVIYIKEPEFDKVPEDLAGFPGLYMSCPEETVGQAITGVYHLAVFQGNSLFSDVVISPGFPLNRESPPVPPKQALVFRNTKQNIHWFLGGPEPEKGKEYELETVKLINFKDYTGDGQAHEFMLTGETSPCGHTQYLIAGYDKQNKKAIVYPIIKENNKTVYWHDNFIPGSSGKVEWFLGCGDHGSMEEYYKLYQFNSGSKAYLLLEDKKTLCFGNDWKTYKNSEYGFEIKYPPEVTFSSLGPNYAQQVLDSGSGTVQPSFDTIVFSDANGELARIEIFHKYDKEITEEDYKDAGYLYTYGPCDVRWGFEPKLIGVNSINGKKTLTVTGKNEDSVCYYQKNSENNLIVTSNKGYKGETFNLMFYYTFKFFGI